MNRHDVLTCVQPLLSALVACDTVSHTDPAQSRGNQSLIHQAAGWLDDCGFHCTLQPVSDRTDNFNLIARRGSGSGGLWLCGHADTVAADPAHWHTDPWQLSATDDEQGWQGLGVADMKGFIASAIALAYRYAGSTPHKPFTILITADEETSMAGARELVARGMPDASAPESPDMICIGEPTANLPVTAHKGFAGLQVRFSGNGGHSSYAGQYPDALAACNEFLNRLYQLRESWQHRYHYEGFELPWPTLNPGVLRAGDSLNRICSHACLKLEFRPVPELDIQEAIREITSIAQQTAATHKLQYTVEQNHTIIPAFRCTEDVSVTEQLCGHHKTTMGFCTEAPFFSRFCPRVVVMGPGQPGQAHQANETLFFTDLVASVNTYDKLLQRHCFPENSV